MPAKALLYALLLTGLALLAGCLPLLRQWRPRTLQAVTAFAAGVLLGIVFLELLPALAEDHSTPSMWAFVLAGVLLVFFSEVVLCGGDHEGPDHRRLVGASTFVGLTLHSVVESVGIGLTFEDERLLGIFLSALFGHKAIAAFSLVSVLAFTGAPRRTIWLLLVFFALTAPIGIVAGAVGASRIPADFLILAQGLAAGSLLYVPVAELLPHLFHHRVDLLLRFLLVLAGVVIPGLALEHAHFGGH